jgi:hypothetical protein
LIRNIPPYSRVGLATPDFQLHITGQRGTPPLGEVGGATLESKGPGALAKWPYFSF